MDDNGKTEPGRRQDDSHALWLESRVFHLLFSGRRPIEYPQGMAIFRYRFSGRYCGLGDFLETYSRARQSAGRNPLTPSGTV